MISLHANIKAGKDIIIIIFVIILVYTTSCSPLKTYRVINVTKPFFVKIFIIYN